MLTMMMKDLSPHRQDHKALRVGLLAAVVLTVELGQSSNLHFRGLWSLSIHQGSPQSLPRKHDRTAAFAGSFGTQRWRNQRQKFIATLAVGWLEIEANRANALEVLELAPGSSKSQLRYAYRTKAKKFHPDRFQGSLYNADEVARQFMAVHTAYKELLKIGTGSAPKGVEENEGPPREVQDALWDGRFAWELSVDDFENIDIDMMRAVIWYSLGVGLKRFAWETEMRLPPLSSSRGELEQVLIPMLDEIVRRELLIKRAQAAGNVQQASKLYLQRSLRHQVRDKWLVACQSKHHADDFAYANQLLERFKTLTEAKADITADEGAYPSEWDRSEEQVADIRRARVKARKGNTAREPDVLEGSCNSKLTGFFRIATRAVTRQQQQMNTAH